MSMVSQVKEFSKSLIGLSKEWGNVHSMAEVSRATIDYRVDFLAKKKLRTSKPMIHTY